MHFGVGTLKINQSLEALFTFCFYINNCLTYVCLADKHQTACARWPLSNVNILLIEAILSQGIFYFRKTFYVDGIEANSNCLCGGRLDYSALSHPYATGLVDLEGFSSEKITHDGTFNSFGVPFGLKQKLQSSETVTRRTSLTNTHTQRKQFSASTL